MRGSATSRARVRAGAFAVAAAACLVFVACVPVRAWVNRTLGADHAALLVDFGLYNVVYVAAAVSLLSGPPDAPRRERLGWWAMAAGLLTSAAGNAYYTLVLSPDIVYPSWADVLYLTWYPLGYVAVVLLLTARVGRFPLSVWLDGLVVGAGVAAVAAALWFEPLTTSDPGTALPTVLFNMAYPVADLLLVGLLAGVAFIVRSRLQAWLALLGLGLLVTAVADVVSAVQVVDDTYVEGGWVDPGWLVGVLALAAAGLVVRRADPVDGLDLLARRRGGSLRVMAVPLASAAASLGLLQLGQGNRFPPVAGVFAGLCIAVAGLRAVLTFRDLVRLADVHREARTDDLTRLPNRRALYEGIEHALAKDTGAGRPTSLLLIDLDGFKEVNDGLGHAVGDDLLVAFARRMEEAVRPGEMLARLGGDEFAVLATGTGSVEAVRLAWRLVRETSEPYEVGAVRLSVDLSVGVATVAPGSGSRGDLLRQADVAMYQAKGSPQRVSAFVQVSGAEHDARAERLALLTRLREGLARPHGAGTGTGRVELHVQPQVSLGERRLVGVEALARWRDHDGALLSPAEFLPLVQRGGLLPALAVVVLDGAVRVARRLAVAGIDVPVAVNLSAVDIHDIALPGRIATVLAREGVAPASLVVELTEDSLVTDPAAAAQVLADLRDLGVRVSLDDFGTGYS